MKKDIDYYSFHFLKKLQQCDSSETQTLHGYMILPLCQFFSSLMLHLITKDCNFHISIDREHTKEAIVLRNAQNNVKKLKH